MAQEGVFWHECDELGCHIMIEFEDEPKCFDHSPDEGSSVPGYSARAKVFPTTERGT